LADRERDGAVVGTGSYGAGYSLRSCAAAAWGGAARGPSNPDADEPIELEHIATSPRLAGRRLATLKNRQVFLGRLRDRGHTCVDEAIAGCRDSSGHVFNGE
jgi:hypothetical protein